jgi:ATP-dependent helicase Lhr and Lhr-like helicase
VPSEEAIGTLRFGECLPPAIAGEVFSAPFSAPEAIETIRQEPMRVVVASE